MLTKLVKGRSQVVFQSFNTETGRRLCARAASPGSCRRYALVASIGLALAPFGNVFAEAPGSIRILPPQSEHRDSGSSADKESRTRQSTPAKTKRGTNFLTDFRPGSGYVIESPVPEPTPANPKTHALSDPIILKPASAALAAEPAVTVVAATADERREDAVPAETPFLANLEVNDSAWTTFRPGVGKSPRPLAAVGNPPSLAGSRIRTWEERCCDHLVNLTSGPSTMPGALATPPTSLAAAACRRLPLPNELVKCEVASPASWEERSCSQFADWAFVPQSNAPQLSSPHINSASAGQIDLIAASAEGTVCRLTTVTAELATPIEDFGAVNLAEIDPLVQPIAQSQSILMQPDSTVQVAREPGQLSWVSDSGGLELIEPGSIAPPPAGAVIFPENSSCPENFAAAPAPFVPRIQLHTGRFGGEPLSALNIDTRPLIINFSDDDKQQAPTLATPDQLPVDVASKLGANFNNAQFVGTGQVRAEHETGFYWAAPDFFHRPLYFEQPQVERYGHYLYGDCVQSAISASHFFATVSILPYKLGAEPKDCCDYTLGRYRPGNCNPRGISRNSTGLSPRGLLYQGLATAGAVWVIP